MAEGIETVDGVEMYRISNVDEMDPFLMTVVSNSDLWMFVSSSGGLTAGRVDRDNCIFPYETDDRLHRLAGQVGPATVLRVRTTDGEVVWEPFAGAPNRTRRSLLKSLLGNSVVFEEEHIDLGLTFRYGWAPSDRFGWVRTATLDNRGESDLSVDIVDGLLDVMPWGLYVTLQQQMSNLANAYRRSEIDESGIGVFTLEAAIIDRPEPAESLRATTVWATGFDAPLLGVDRDAVEMARRGQPFPASRSRTGRPGSFLLNAVLDLERGRGHRWQIVADVGQGHADIARLIALIRSSNDVSRQLDDDIHRSSSELRGVLAGADGMQLTASAKTDAHHLANTLFNVMRGGTFPNGYSVRADRFRTFVRDRNRIVAERHTDWLDGLPEAINIQDLRTRAAEVGDPNLVRLAHEYLPLAFSRRHGDPSRPWNQFAIRVRDRNGEPLLSYQGNWRDIFQNWEALCRSFPAFLPSVVSKFLSASTADGFNPYRITSDGIDWEVPEPDNPWSGIGYWGDHQIVYLYRLLRAQEAHSPGWLTSGLGLRRYAFADVPYRIAPHDELVRDPKSTIEYDPTAEARVATRVNEVGADGKLLPDTADGVLHVTLLEKLLVPALAKISNFVPRGGIWMNTQRPEWNDANNALVGYGLSMVTLAHLRRYLQLIDEVTADLTEAHPVSSGVITWIESATSVLEGFERIVDGADLDDEDRAGVIHGLGEAYGEYRSGLYEHGPAALRPLAADAVRRLVAVTLRHLDDAIRAARRPDGLYEAYNLLKFSGDGRAASVGHLPLMLEGQVAMISSGLLGVDDVIALVRAMYESELYRPDVDSFVLYPPRLRPPFLSRNQVPAEAVESNPLLRALLDAGAEDVIVRDVDGRYHFNADFRNIADLNGAVERLAGTSVEHLAREHLAETQDLFERVFNHHEFTGRSSTMYAFEGIGSVYWHMVAKLLIAVQEQILEAPPETDAGRLRELIDLYGRIRHGLGFNKTAAEYGAFPTDPYSHTPAHAGAQQPGMTGQVKEELLARWAELGLTVEDGSMCFTPSLLGEHEFRSEPGELEYLDVADRPRRLAVDRGSAAFTVCQVPVVVHATETDPTIVVTEEDGTEREVAGSSLDQTTSREIFDRTGRVTRVDVFMGSTASA